METKYDHITDEFNLQKETLERQIINIEIRQQEIQNLIVTIENANNYLDTLIKQEKDNRRKASLYGAKTKNVELLTKLYDTYNRFEDVKFKYHNNISDIMFKSHRLIEVEIRKIDEKLNNLNNNDLVEMFNTMSKMFSNNSDIPPEIKDKIITDEEEFRI